MNQTTIGSFRLSLGAGSHKLCRKIRIKNLHQACFLQVKVIKLKKFNKGMYCSIMIYPEGLDIKIHNEMAPKSIRLRLLLSKSFKVTPLIALSVPHHCLCQLICVFSLISRGFNETLRWMRMPREIEWSGRAGWWPRLRKVSKELRSKKCQL